jgi:hypothetical protein
MGINPVRGCTTDPTDELAGSLSEAGKGGTANFSTSKDLCMDKGDYILSEDIIDKIDGEQSFNLSFELEEIDDEEPILVTEEAVIARNDVNLYANAKCSGSALNSYFCTIGISCKNKVKVDMDYASEYFSVIVWFIIPFMLLFYCYEMRNS